LKAKERGNFQGGKDGFLLVEWEEEHTAFVIQSRKPGREVGSKETEELSSKGNTSKDLAEN